MLTRGRWNFSDRLVSLRGSVLRLRVAMGLDGAGDVRAAEFMINEGCMSVEVGATGFGRLVWIVAAPHAG